MADALAVGMYINDQADLNYYTMMLNRISAQYEANAEKFSKMKEAEETYYESYDDAINHGEGDKALTAGGKQWVAKDEKGVSVSQAKGYANAKAKTYDANLMMILEENDLEFESLQSMYEALVTYTQSKSESDKQFAQQALQDNGLFTS